MCHNGSESGWLTLPSEIMQCTLSDLLARGKCTMELGLLVHAKLCPSSCVEQSPELVSSLHELKLCHGFRVSTKSTIQTQQSSLETLETST